MSTLILELSDDQIQTFERLAQQRRKSIHAMVRAFVDDLAAHGAAPDNYDLTQDPIYHITPHETGAPADLSQHADDYLYGARKQGEWNHKASWLT